MPIGLGAFQTVKIYLKKCLFSEHLIPACWISIRYGIDGCWLFRFCRVHPKGFTAANSVAGQQILEPALNFHFSVLPLLILMGVFVARAALSDDWYDASNKWLEHFRGGLAMATVAACSAFAKSY